MSDRVLISAPTAHIGRSWEGHPLEDECPCPKAPCGLVSRDNVDPTCLQHPVERYKSMRQGHWAEHCPGAAS